MWEWTDHSTDADEHQTGILCVEDVFVQGSDTMAIKSYSTVRVKEVKIKAVTCTKNYSIHFLYGFASFEKDFSTVLQLLYNPTDSYVVR